MHITSENILLIGSILLFLSVFAGKTTGRFGIPVLALFIGLGMLAGSEGIGGIYFDNPKSTQFIGIVALNFILFSGGFDTSWYSIKPVLSKGIALSTIGVLLTAISIGIFVWQFTDFSFFEGLLLGSIVSSTDSAAVFSILRSKGIALKGNLRSTLELESGSNDPMAYVLTIACTGIVVNQDANVATILQLFFQQIIVGASAGYVFGKFGKYIINHIKLEYESLYIVLVIALIFFNFSLTDYLGGNGFLSVYLSAVMLGNQDLIHKKKIIKSFDSFAWLMQIVLFITLGLLIYPSNIIPILGIGIVISAFIMFVARPIGVFFSLFFFKEKMRNISFISWVGLRGAVPIVFATYPLIAGVAKAEMIFNIVFFISFTSVIIQGTTLPFVAKMLGLSLPLSAKKRNQTDLLVQEGIKKEFVEIQIPIKAKSAGKRIVDLGFPKTSIIAMIKRNDLFITPNGDTIIHPNDVLLIFSENKKSLEFAEFCLL